MKRDRKGQEEMMGFVLIVVLVVVIGLVFLVITLRNSDSRVYESKDLRAFLKGAMEFTSDCAIGWEPNYIKIGDSLKGCYEGKKCLSGEDVCKVINDTLPEMIERSWNVGPNSPVKGYVFNVSYVSNSSSSADKNVILLTGGNCSFETLSGAEDFYPAYPGNIEYELLLCY